MNDMLDGFIFTYRVVTQGDLMYSILFNYVMDFLSVMARNAQHGGVITGMVPHLHASGIAIL
jgi:hypothetical protein